ncbi:hypothetical protein SAMN05428976_10746 [Clostridium sp. USBA 49]|uniref:hypothetical protein n=1 Tax=Clostridium sp. USBA 49 TaxID=1881060 RepID=UPI000999E18E|nr:hypothetical protein [Clostridium sp. USBA 49]SKA85123.1 hypothetical protein SAMN05428976_10746 [Clostridium sp. USBA 49]
MENNQKQKLGAGILTLSIIQLVFSGFGMIGFITYFAVKDQIAAVPGVPVVPAYTYIISIIVTIVAAIGIILILFKKELGIYIYYIAQVASIISSLVINGFKPLMILSLIIPILMGFFIWNKKEVFGIGVKAGDVNM